MLNSRDTKKRILRQTDKRTDKISYRGAIEETDKMSYRGAMLLKSNSDTINDLLCLQMESRPRL